MWWREQGHKDFIIISWWPAMIKWTKSFGAVLIRTRLPISTRYISAHFGLSFLHGDGNDINFRIFGTLIAHVLCHFINRSWRLCSRQISIAWYFNGCDFVVWQLALQVLRKLSPMKDASEQSSR
ncbi:hypothetical protein AK965_09015 [Vibrio sp. PID17_43]|nr:hypothetical protein AK965_09015 [Vibrio sp. PID17_43]